MAGKLKNARDKGEVSVEVSLLDVCRRIEAEKDAAKRRQLSSPGYGTGTRSVSS